MPTLISKTLKRIAGRPNHSVANGGEAPALHRPSTSISGHFYPFFEAVRTRVVAKAEAAQRLCPDDGLPIPPRALHAGYGFDEAGYLDSGREQHRTMMQIVGESGLILEPGARILDFGCAAGRMMRCFKSSADRNEIWGVDIRADHILWCQRNLSPPFRFVTSTTYPHLPFEDNHFSFIYACSVFTHIGDLEDTWLLELRRILRPGGRIFATVHDNHTLDVVLSSPPGHWVHDTLLRRQFQSVDSTYDVVKSGFSMVSINQDEPGNAQVLHDREFLRHRWGQFLRILSIHPEAHAYQTAIVMAK
jgi:ubiquinone/menaquinone biosynthesis C-methylase UbiE